MKPTPQAHTSKTTTIPFAEFPAFILNRAKEQERTVYSIIDSAQDENIFLMLKNSGWEYTCLYKKNIHYEGDRMVEELAATAPYLIALDPAKMDIASFIRERLGKNQIIILESAAPIQEITDHCSSMLKAMDEEGKVINFRYYDPRILRVYLPTCTDEETYIFFGDIDTIWVESEDDRVLQFEKQGEEVIEEPVAEPSPEQKETEKISGIVEEVKEPVIQSGGGVDVIGEFFKDA